MSDINEADTPAVDEQPQQDPLQATADEAQAADEVQATDEAADEVQAEQTEAPMAEAVVDTDAPVAEEALYTEAELPEGALDDLAKLTSLNTETLLHELQVRYNNDVIYTNVSDILIAVNPFKDLPLYTPEVAAKYNNTLAGDAPPHVYAIADACYNNLFKMQKNQCAVISGESGAGKTVSAKHIIRHIIDLSCADQSARSLEDRIIEVSPLLEAFGNAQTTMNDNSSRFGKYTRLLFDMSGRAMGVQISEYLLEKSRVVEQHSNERNFHVFYYLFASAGAADLGLSSPSDFSGLCGELWPDNEAMYTELVEALNAVGFSAEDQETLHEVLAAVLHLTNVEFEKIDDDSSQLTRGGDATVKRVAQLLGVEEESFAASLTHIHTITRGEHIKRPYTKDQAYDCRDAVAKGIYARVFSWIVAKINEKLAPELYSKANARPGVAAKQKAPSFEIGVLDIFGFENFGMNSFEQLCINVAHEQLQYFFNEHTFRLELEEYKLEEINAQSANIVFVDNKPLIDMFLNTPVGIFKLLDEESTFPKATDASFVEKIDKAFVDHDFYTKIIKKREYPAFAIAHFPGQVEYNATHFLEKNRDNLAADIVNVMQDSRVGMVYDTFHFGISATGQLDIELSAKRVRRGEVVNDASAMTAVANTANKKAPSLSHQFKSSLTDLVAKMTACFPHFVRCIKPNLQQLPNDFEETFVKTQLGYTGVLEATRIRREGFSWRPTFAEFVRRFKILAFPTHLLKRVNENRTAAKKILDVVNLAPVHVGKTKLFLKWFHEEEMENRLEKYYKDVIKCQSACRAYFAKKIYKRRLARAEMSAQERAQEEAREAAEAQAREEARLERERKEEEQRLQMLEIAQAEKEKAEIERERAEAEAKAAEEERLAKQAELDKMAAEEQLARLEAEKEEMRVQRALSVARRKEDADKLKLEVDAKNKRVADLQRMLEEAMLQASEAEVRALKAEAALTVEEVKEQEKKKQEEKIAQIADMRSDEFDFVKWHAHISNNKPIPEEMMAEKTRVVGPVSKTGGRHRGWKQRWFVLDSAAKTFSYYDSEKLKKEKGRIQGETILRAFVPKSAEASSTNFHFVVETVDRTYFCKASSNELRQAWMDMFSAFPEFYKHIETSY